MRRSRGFRSKSRDKLTKKVRKGESNLITKAMQQFENGEKVAIVIDPAVHHGMPHPRYHGITGEVVDTQGRSYIIKIMDKSKVKHIVAMPEHLKRIS